MPMRINFTYTTPDKLSQRTTQMMAEFYEIICSVFNWLNFQVVCNVEALKQSYLLINFSVLGCNSSVFSALSLQIHI